MSTVGRLTRVELIPKAQDHTQSNDDAEDIDMRNTNNNTKDTNIQNGNHNKPAVPPSTVVSQYVQEPPSKRRKIDYNTMSKLDLKALCIKRRLKRSGTKDVLIQRLQDPNNPNNKSNRIA